MMRIIRNERTAGGDAPDQQVAECAHRSGDGGPFADVEAQHQRGKQRQEKAHREKHRAGHDRHVQAGNREDVDEAGVAIGGVGCRRDAAAPNTTTAGGGRKGIAGVF